MPVSDAPALKFSSENESRVRPLAARRRFAYIDPRQQQRIPTMRKLVLAAAAALALSVSAHAQTPGSVAPADVQAGAYTVEPNHTRVLFAVSHFGFTTYYGEFVGASGALSLDPKNIGKSHLEVTVPVSGISTPSDKLTGELKGADWFDAAQFPTISFKSTAIAPTGADTADITGDLTMHGVTRQVTLKAKFNAAGVSPVDKAYTTGFEVSGHVKRTDFGVSKYAPYIGDDVHLIISAAFEHAPS
jgi:polyisoprenoid-binding protein YceI